MCEPKAGEAHMPADVQSTRVMTKVRETHKLCSAEAGMSGKLERPLRRGEHLPISGLLMRPQSFMWDLSGQRFLS